MSGQNWAFAENNSTFMDADNCVYHLVNVQTGGQGLSDYTNLQSLLANSQVVLTDSEETNQVNAQNLFNSKNLIQSNVVDDQAGVEVLHCGDEMLSSDILFVSGTESRNDFIRGANEVEGLTESDEVHTPSTVIQVEDLKNELKTIEQIEDAKANDHDTAPNELSDVTNKEEVVEVKDKTSAQITTNELDADVNIELPRDPKELLDTLTPILENNGGLKKNMQESFLKIMKSCEPMPLQCLLINIIRSSQDSVLKRLLLMGGFDELHAWLREARSQINKPLMLELLQLFKVLPVTTKLLRTNSCAKEIKQLIKNNDERISRFARVIVDHWMNIVSGSSAKPKEKVKAAEQKSEKKTTKSQASTPPKSPKPESKAKVEKTEVANEKSPTSDNNEDKVVKAERPKTVKRRQYTFRMTGLEEDATFKSTKKTAISTATTTTTTMTTASALSGGPPSPKKNDSDPAKSSFFDALQFNSSFLQHRKRKSQVSAKNSTSISSTTSTTTSAITTAAVTTTPATTVTTASTVSTATTVATAISQVAAEDDLSNILPGFSYYKPMEDSEPSKATDATATKAPNSSLSPKNNDDADIPPVTKKPKSLKKSVSWASDTILCDFRYFEVDPTERCNVNTSNYFQHEDHDSFVVHRRQEFEMERQLLQEWHKTKQVPLEAAAATIEWHTPQLLEYEAPNDVVPGCESRERAVQLERETAVLQFIYFDKSTIPDFPNEPDASSESPAEVTECKPIPLHAEEESEEPMETDQEQPLPNQEPNLPVTPPTMFPTTTSNAPITSQNILPPILSNMINNVLNNNSTAVSPVVNESPALTVSSGTANNNINNVQNPASYESNNHINNQNYASTSDFSEGANLNVVNKNNFANNPNNSFENYPNNENPPYMKAYNDNYANNQYNNPPYNNGVNTDYNYNDLKSTDPAFFNQPFNQSNTNPVYPIGFNQMPPFDSSNQRPPFDGGRGYQARGNHRDFHGKFRHNGNFPAKKFNRNKNIDKSEVCRFFLQGKCVFGNNCKKIHPPK